MIKLNHISFISFLRGPAALFVVWDHLVAHWLDNNDLSWGVLEFSRTYITTPLAIRNDFGFFGVSLFFLISGFIITHVANSDSRSSFILKRVARVYPPLIVSILLIVFVYSVYTYLTGAEHYLSKITLGDVLMSFTMINYVLIPQNPVNLVAWTLFIEMLFYIICFTIFPVIKKYPSVSNFGIVSFCFLVIYFSRDLGDNFFLFAASIAYFPYLLMGQLLYLLKNKKISLKIFIALSSYCYLVLVYGIISIHSEFYPSDNSYGVSFFYSYLIFIIAMLLDKFLKPTKFINFYSAISYSLYLNHYAIGSLIITLLYPYLGYSFSLGISFAIVTFTSYLSYRYIEEPSRKLVRSWTSYKIN